MKALLKKAEEGDEVAQINVTDGYAHGINGFPQDPEALLECANKGWGGAQFDVVSGYLYGCYGFPQDPEALFKLVSQKDWEDGEWYLCQQYLDDNDTKSLLKLSNEYEGKEARELVIDGYTHGTNGFPKDLEKAEEYRRKWEEA